MWKRRILYAFLALLAAGIAYEQYGRRSDRTRYPPIGRSIDIGGRTLNIFCSGSGSPPVILESGGAGPGLQWQQFLPRIAEFTQACWYDRAGEGWSDPGPYPRTSAAIASDLHLLLAKAGIPPPYVIAGASFGGLNARVYANLYPHEVAGLVLIDPAHEDEPLRAPKFFLAKTAPRWLWFPLHLLVKTAANVGFFRLTNSAPPGDILRGLQSQPEAIASNISTGITYPASYDQARAITTLGDIPLTVLSAGKPAEFGNPELDKQAAAYQQVVIHEMHPKLARLSSRGRQIVVENSGHVMLPRAADTVLSAIRETVLTARQQPNH